MIPEFDLHDQVAIVTGGGRSLGRAISGALAEAGASVVVADVQEDAAKAVAAEITGAGGAAVAMSCDVSREPDVRRLVGETVGELGRLDIMVANAGVFQTWMPPEDNSVEEWNRVLATNLTGVMLSCLEAGRHMKEHDGGSIIATSSIVGHAGLSGNFSYNVSKHGVIGIVRSLAVEWAEYRVRVNAVCPGFITRDVEPLQGRPRGHRDDRVANTARTLRRTTRHRSRSAVPRVARGQVRHRHLPTHRRRMARSVNFQMYMDIALQRIKAIEDERGRGPFYRLDEAMADLKRDVPGIWPFYAAKMIEYREWGRVFFSSAGTPIVSLSDKGRDAAPDHDTRDSAQASSVVVEG